MDVLPLWVSGQVWAWGKMEWESSCWRLPSAWAWYSRTNTLACYHNSQPFPAKPIKQTLNLFCKMNINYVPINLATQTEHTSRCRLYSTVRGQVPSQMEPVLFLIPRLERNCVIASARFVAFPFIFIFSLCLSIAISRAISPNETKRACA